MGLCAIRRGDVRGSDGRFKLLVEGRAEPVELWIKSVVATEDKPRVFVTLAHEARTLTSN